MAKKDSYDIVVVQGDGIGPEVCSATIEVLNAAFGNRQKLAFDDHDAGAGTFQRTGSAFPKRTFEACEASDAILHGAAGLPGVTHPDGTEAGLDFGLQLRFRLDLFANIRPIKLLPGIVSPLRRFEPGRIDYVILRENTEGLYSARGGGNLLHDSIASDTMLITRTGTERVVRTAFELARKRNGAPRDGKRRVTVCDKANVLRSYAFFRKVATEVAADYPDIELDYALADAMTAHLINRPDFYDVIVTENMFGDIISDLGAATVGSMGMSPTGEVGANHGFFQAAHGSAPDIAGQGVANPIGTVLASVLMLDWLGERHGDEELVARARRIEAAVAKVLAEGRVIPPDLGGEAGTAEVTRAVVAAL